MNFARLRLAFAAGLTATAAGASFASGGDPLAQAKSHANLVAAGGLAGKDYAVGMDIRLEPGVMTYWSFPGDAGVPPVFDFSGSDNVAKATVVYPAPTRIVEDGASVFGWRDEVVIPIDVAPRDPSRPSRLNVDLHYATCDVICVPAEANETIALDPHGAPSADAAKLASWRARVPVPLPAPMTPRVVRAAGDGSPRWRVTFGSFSERSDLIVVGGDGWFFGTAPAGPGAWDVTLEQKPPDAAKIGAPATLTYLDGDHAYQAAFDLDGAAGLR